MLVLNKTELSCYEYVEEGGCTHSTQTTFAKLGAEVRRPRAWRSGPTLRRRSGRIMFAEGGWAE